SAFDEMSPRAAAGYAGGSPESRAARDRLRAALSAEGFTGERHEWWHFNHRTCSAYPVLDVPFDRLPGQSAEMRESDLRPRRYISASTRAGDASKPSSSELRARTSKANPARRAAAAPFRPTT